MDLILWRHAEAEAGAPDEPDDDRVLTQKGHKQASRMARWLDQNLPNGCKILVSPAIRTLQTARALDRKFKVHQGLAQDATPASLLAAANWPDNREPVVLVGHQPSLGQLAALLISGVEQDWAIRKGNVWWIAQREGEDASGNFLRAVMAPELITK
ncbi:SixA phosphatase family protein [Actimicrobium antarcticum]|uniref:Phosphohistidine phosphatase SixA n=1 Tax=Actimicrobium antarcticum TaxID=1051899 RepID=A0ABP7STB8_9BURK